MNIWNKVLLGLIFLFGLVAIYFSTGVLKFYKDRGKAYDAAVTSLSKEIQTADDLMKFDKIPTLEIKSNALLNDLSERWLNCRPVAVAPLENQHTKIDFQLDLEKVTPMKVGDMFYAFDQRPHDKGGRYLGRFMVTKAQGSSTTELNVTAESVDILTDLEKQQLTSSLQEVKQATPASTEETETSGQELSGWAMYLKCPAHNLDFVGGLSDEDWEKFSQNLPESIKKAYGAYRDAYQTYTGGNMEGPAPKAAEIMPEGYVYDYGTYFTAAYQKRIENSVEKSILDSQLRDLQESETRINNYSTAFQNQYTQLTEDNRIMEAQKAEIQELCNELDQTIADLKEKIRETQRNNEKRLRDIQTSQQAVSRSASTTNYPVNK